MNINDLFFEFSHQGRYNIFRSLCEKQKKHSQLNKEFKITGPEITRHLKRLSEKRLINKREDNKYEATSIGKLFYRVFDFFEIVLKNVDFFNTHDSSSIPLFLIYKLGQLSTVETSKKTLENIELWSNFVKNSEEYILAVSDQFQNSLLPIVEKKVHDQSIEIRAIVDKKLLNSYKMPDEWSKQFRDPITFYKKFKIYENIKILEKIDFSLIISEKGAILFLSRKGEIDYSQCLIDNHPSFINWTTELFEWHWNKGKELKPFIRKEIRAKK